MATAKRAALALLALVSLGGAPGILAYKRCRIVNGQVFSCEGAWYQGTTATNHDGAFRECRIVNGQVYSCGSWFQGEAPALHEGAWHQCKIVNGKIFSCAGAWYQGEAVVRTER